MFILTVSGKNKEGAYSVTNSEGNQILYMFEQKDDAVRFSMMLEDKDYPELEVVDVDTDLMIQTCEMHEYNYAIITANDLVIPPDED
jgi:hypothetical protein